MSLSADSPPTEAVIVGPEAVVRRLLKGPWVYDYHACFFCGSSTNGSTEAWEAEDPNDPEIFRLADRETHDDDCVYGMALAWAASVEMTPSPQANNMTGSPMSESEAMTVEISGDFRVEVGRDGDDVYIHFNPPMKLGPGHSSPSRKAWEGKFLLSKAEAAKLANALSTKLSE